MGDERKEAHTVPSGWWIQSAWSHSSCRMLEGKAGEEAGKKETLRLPRPAGGHAGL